MNVLSSISFPALEAVLSAPVEFFRISSSRFPATVKLFRYQMRHIDRAIDPSDGQAPMSNEFRGSFPRVTVSCDKLPSGITTTTTTTTTSKIFLQRLPGFFHSSTLE